MTRWKREFNAWAARYPVAFAPKRWQDWDNAKTMTQVAAFLLKASETPPATQPRCWRI